MLNWVWGLGNNVPWALLTLVPPFMFFMPFVLGARGNVWAWRAGGWSDPEQFAKKQRLWFRVAVYSYPGVVGFIALIFLAGQAAMFNSDPYVLAMAAARNSQDIEIRLGRPVHSGWTISGTINMTDDNGEARINFDLTGPAGYGTVWVKADRHNGDWALTTLEFEDAATDEIFNIH